MILVLNTNFKKEHEFYVCCESLYSDNFFLQRFGNRFGIAVDMEFGVNILHVRTNGFIRTSDGVGNHFKTFAFDQLLEDFLFFWGQLVI